MNIDRQKNTGQTAMAGDQGWNLPYIVFLHRLCTLNTLSCNGRQREEECP